MNANSIGLGIYEAFAQGESVILSFVSDEIVFSLRSTGYRITIFVLITILLVAWMIIWPLVKGILYHFWFGVPWYSNMAIDMHPIYRYGSSGWQNLVFKLGNAFSLVILFIWVQYIFQDVSLNWRMNQYNVFGIATIGYVIFLFIYAQLGSLNKQQIQQSRYDLEYNTKRVNRLLRGQYKDKDSGESSGGDGQETKTLDEFSRNFMTHSLRHRPFHVNP